MVGGVKALILLLVVALAGCGNSGDDVESKSSFPEPNGLPTLGAKKKTDAEEAGYKGRVKSVRKFSYEIEEKFGKPVRTQGGLGWTYKYDEKGNRTETVWYDASGEI